MLDGYHILVADDNILNQKIANFILQKLGATVKAACNGREAIELLPRENFDVVLMDLQMPEMDGYEAAKHIREVIKSDIPIIALTASVSEDGYDQSINAGMNACIPKPFDGEKLCELILTLTKQTTNSSLSKTSV